jgi:phosphoribosylformimino-5-aminoimidazole carboxamide ribotide isomerase
MEIIPAIDIIEGKCVRLSQGDYAQKKIYNENPLEVAKQFEDAGIRRLHLVDLDGAKKGTIVNQKVLETIASKTKLVIDFGGGIKTDADIQSVFNAGATIATIGSLAVKNSELFFDWVKKYGSEKILLGADVKNEKIAVSGWTEQTELSVFDFIKTNLEKGVKNIFCTDIAKDGMMQGASTELYKKIKDQLPSIHLIASGGVTSLKDLDAVQEAGCSGAIIGKAIYEGTILLSELKPFLA